MSFCKPSQLFSVLESEMIILFDEWIKKKDKKQQTYKPGSVSMVGFLSFIQAAGHPAALTAYPPASDEQPLVAGIHGLSTHQVYSPGCHHPDWWALTPPFHPYPVVREGYFLLHYCASRHLPVRKNGALRCPDFPPAQKSRR